jgi:hypothetical protein
MSQRAVLPLLAAAAILGCGVAACYQDDTTALPAAASLTRVLFTDAPFPFDTVQSVNIYVVSVAASTQADTGSSADSMQWVTITQPRQRIDLLTLQQGTTTLLGEGEIPADQYRAVRLIIDTDSSRIRFRDGSDALVHWGGAGQQAIHAFVEAAVAVPEQGADIVIDFDVGRSFHYDDLGDGGFNFLPWIRAVNRAATGSIAGLVRSDTTSGTPGPIAYAGVSAYGASQGTWQIFSTARTDAAGHYRLAYLLPGTYIVAVDPPPSGGFAASLDSTVVVSRGVETDHSVTLSAFRGAVYIVGASSMLVGRTNQLETIVVNAENQQEPNPAVAWANLTPAVLSLTDSARAGKYAWVTSLVVGQGRVVATSRGLADTLVIQVAADTSQPSAMPSRLRRH